jgi:hypothetical protein
MTFLNPFVLFGLLAASLPVLFHLFAQRRARRVEFTSLRFLQKLEKSAMRQVKIRQILLLIIRTLLVVAIVLAFARPAIKGYLGSFFGSSHANTSLVLLFDNSASMSRSDERGELFKRAKESAKQIVSIVEDGDDVAIIPLADIQRGKEYRASHGRKDALAAIEEIRLADRPAELDDGFHIAAQVLVTSKNVNKEVYLLSDDQEGNYQVGPQDTAHSATHAPNQDSSHILRLFDGSTRVFHVAIGEEGRSSLNLAIDSLKPISTILEPGRPVQFAAWVRNTTDVPAQNAVLSLFYNDERVAEQSISAIQPNSTERVSLTGPTHGSGIIAVRAELEPDALPFDNHRFAVLDVPASRRIALFVDTPNDAIFVRLALEQSLAEGGNVPFSTEVHRLDELRSLPALQSRLDGIMVWIGKSGLESADAQAFKEYVSGGHGASVFLMPDIDIKSYNAAMASVAGLPQISSVNGASGDNAHYASFAEIDLSHPFFPGMFDAQSTGASAIRGIESPKVYEYYQVGVPKSDELIGLSEGASFLSEIRSGKGAILLYSVPPTLQFSDFPRKSIFLPLIRRTAAYISAIHSQLDESAEPAFVTTEPFDVFLPELRGVQSGSTLLVKGPAGLSMRAPTRVDAEGHIRIHLDDAPASGIYRVYADAEAHDAIAAFAVNTESGESDLKRASQSAIANFLKARMAVGANALHLNPDQKGFAERILQSRYGVELWQSFLIAALVLALLEMLIAREARMRSAVA